MPLTPGILDELRRLLGPDGLVVSPEGRLVYECDMHTFYKGAPDAVALPERTAEVVAIVNLCHRERVPIVPRGSGTGLIGGATAPLGGVMVGLNRMNRILEIDLPNRCATVQPGLINLWLTRAVEARGWFFAPDPSSQMVSSIGGNVSTNAGDQLEPHDVVGRDPVLEAVRPTGVGRHVAADGRHHLARGVGSEEPPARLDGAREPEVDQPWLDRRTAVRKVDLEDPVHPVQTDHHAAERGRGAADEARARAARDDGHTLTVAEVHDRHDLGRALRQGDGVGGALVEGVHVALVDEPALRRHDEAVGAEEAPELIEDTGSKRHRTTYGGPVRRCARYLPRSGASRCRRARAPRSPSAPGRA